MTGATGASRVLHSFCAGKQDVLPDYFHRKGLQCHGCGPAQGAAVAHIKGGTVQRAENAMPLEFTPAEALGGVGAQIVHGEQAIGCVCLLYTF